MKRAKTKNPVALPPLLRDGPVARSGDPEQLECTSSVQRVDRTPFSFVPHFNSEHHESEAITAVIAFCEHEGIPFQTFSDGEVLLTVAQQGARVDALTRATQLDR